ncbi:hypothetical protein CO540_29290 [Micromonospora sp. WMMA2032]|uniref:PH domain-containing protein n=1 Tax=unclassified Micromonospora TaxID=2617518 RepID=UPI000C05AEDF|nr:PH domain-containing protein [Micromonospora sp. WMMA2032]ATO17423.1 hypothetical protein CO540_29290 [Micromonospora sp. WMMA2032]
MSEQHTVDVAAAVERMGSRIGAGRELKELESHLQPEERVKALVAGRHGPGNGLLVLTGQRVFFFFDGLVRDDFVSASLDRIENVEWKTGVNLGTITVSGDEVIEVSGVDKDGGDFFVAALGKERGRPAGT